MNETKNQHFVSQAEQRLNALNPAAKPENQRIYAFEVVDRDRRVLRLTGERGQPIGKSLSMLDLFSFDVDEIGDMRANLETEFGRYEQTLLQKTEAIRNAAQSGRQDIGDDVIALFVAKMINFVRNPFCVRKVLDTFKQVAEHHPTDQTIYRLYLRTLSGRQPQRDHLCRKLGITPDEYSTWLRLLFMLLTPMAADYPNILEGSLRTLLMRPDVVTSVFVHWYDGERCLLSDRGHSMALPQANGLVLDFNLAADSFVRYCLFHPAAISVPEGIMSGLQQGPKPIFVYFVGNNLPMLEVYHRRIIEQAAAHVYCSGREPYASTVLPSSD